MDLSTADFKLNSLVVSNKKLQRLKMEERIIDRIMTIRVRIGKIELKVVDLLFIMCLFIFAFIIRWKLMPIESADYWGFLEDWMKQIRAAGGFPSLNQQISNYTSPTSLGEVIN